MKNTYYTENGITTTGEITLIFTFYTSIIMNPILIIGSFYSFYLFYEKHFIVALFSFIALLSKGLYSLSNDYYLYYVQKNITELTIDNFERKVLLKYKSKLNEDFQEEIKFEEITKIEEGNGSTRNIMSRLAWGKAISIHANNTIYNFAISHENKDGEYFQLYKLLTEIVENNK